MEAVRLIYLDTHVAVWLHAGADEKLSRQAASAIRRNDLLVSPTVLLELGFLHEVGRIKEPPAHVLGTLHVEFGVRLCDLAFASAANASLDQSWTRDPFDRLIVGQAIAGRRQLVTADQTIRDNFPDAVW